MKLINRLFENLMINVGYLLNVRTFLKAYITYTLEKELRGFLSQFSFINVFYIAQRTTPAKEVC